MVVTGINDVIVVYIRFLIDVYLIVGLVDGPGIPDRIIYNVGEDTKAVVREGIDVIMDFTFHGGFLIIIF